MEGLEKIIRSHPFFSGLEERFITLIAGCAKNVRFEAGQFIFHEGENADMFYLIRHGKVALQVHAPAGPTTFQTIAEGELVGVSWLVPPYRWSYDAKAAETTIALAMDAACLRGKSDADHDLGYEMMKRFMPVLIQRLQATRLQMLDVYGTPSSNREKI